MASLNEGKTCSSHKIPRFLHLIFPLFFFFFRSHKKALRQVAFHRHYPLFASASDDGTVIVCHGRIFK